VEGLQDLGAAGITCAVSETADRSNTGIRVDLDAIPRREPDMAPFEVMISESQERMLAIVTAQQLPDVLEVCRRWDLPAAVIGRVTDDGLISIVTGGLDVSGAAAPGARELARIPAAALTSEAIVHQRVAAAPTRRRPAPVPGDRQPTADASPGLPERGMDPGAVLQALLGHPDLCSRAWVTRQYDSTVGADTVAGNEHGAAVIRVKGTTKGLVMATDAAERVGLLDPWQGAALAVAECTLNVAVTGARALGVTNCLNHGNPERPEAFWELSESVRGLGDACRALGLPITGGNVSLYNESAAGAIAPTCQVGVVGLLDDIGRLVGPVPGGPGERVGLLGVTAPGMGGSIYVDIAGPGPDDRVPKLDLAAHASLLGLLGRAAAVGLLRAAQDVSGGGLAVALAEMCLWAGTGADLTLAVDSEPATELFGEGPSRVVVSVAPGDWDALAALATEAGVPLCVLGETGGDRLRIRLMGQGSPGAAEDRGVGVADDLDEPLDVLHDAWAHGLPRALGDDGWRPEPHGQEG
jgi:phosphoribosylformylglycinamidine synthase II